MSREQGRAKMSDRRPACDAGAARSEGLLAISRRSFFSWAWLALGGLALAETAWLVLSFLRPRPQTATGREERIVSAGPADCFETNSVSAFPQGKFYLARLADGGFLALARECTHLGCTVAWNPKEGCFLCPCHASAFDLLGDVIQSPAPRALDLYAAFIENDEVKVNLSKRSRRDRFEKAQAVYV